MFENINSSFPKVFRKFFFHKLKYETFFQILSDYRGGGYKVQQMGVYKVQQVRVYKVSLLSGSGSECL